MENAAKNQSFGTRQMVRISILGLIGYILLLFNMPLPIFPTFIKLDVANLPSIVASITMGPAAGVLTELVKNLLKGLLSSKTIGIGEVSNFICGSALVIPIGFICRKSPGIKSYILGAAAGIVLLSITACLSNYFFIIPAYAAAFGGMEAIIALANKVNANVTDLNALIIMAILPFNIIKGVLNSVLGYILYKAARPVFEKVE